MALTKTEKQIVKKMLETVGFVLILLVMSLLTPIPSPLAIPGVFIAVFFMRISNEVDLEEKVEELKKANEALLCELRQLHSETNKQNDLLSNKTEE